MRGAPVVTGGGTRPRMMVGVLPTADGRGWEVWRGDGVGPGTCLASCASAEAGRAAARLLATGYPRQRVTVLLWARRGDRGAGRGGGGARGVVRGAPVVTGGGTRPRMMVGVLPTADGRGWEVWRGDGVGPGTCLASCASAEAGRAAARLLATGYPRQRVTVLL